MQELRPLFDALSSQYFPARYIFVPPAKAFVPYLSIPFSSLWVLTTLPDTQNLQFLLSIADIRSSSLSFFKDCVTTKLRSPVAPCPYSLYCPYNALTVQYIDFSLDLYHEILWCSIRNVVGYEVLNGIIGEEFLKYFDVYTNSVVRRIDDLIMQRA